MALSNQDKLDIYEAMLLIRNTDLKMLEIYKKGEIEGHMLPCMGQEAIPAALAKVYTDDDFLVTGHRGGGHYMARGCNYNALWGELYGRVTGCDRGRGGQIHLMDMGKKAITGNAIVGAQWGIAAGAGFVARKRGVMVVAVGGEGSTNRGPFHEGINLAAVQRLPILYIIEFNNRQMWNSWDETTATGTVYQRAAAYGLEGARVDGNDPEAVYEKAAEFAAKIREDYLPRLIQCDTEKWTDSVNSARNTPEALEVIKSPEVDPICRFGKKLKADGILDDAADEQIKQRVMDKILEAVDFAVASPLPDPDDGVDQVYSQPV